MNKDFFKILIIFNLVLTCFNLFGLVVSVFVLKSLGYTIISLVGLFFNYHNHFNAKEKLDLLEEKENDN